MCKVRQKTEHSSEAQSVASDHHSGTISIIAIYMVSTVSDLLHSSETIFFSVLLVLSVLRRILPPLWILIAAYK